MMANGKKCEGQGANSKGHTSRPAPLPSGDSAAQRGAARVLPEGERFFTKIELARILKVSVRTVDEMMQAGEIPFLKIRGWLVRFRLEDVERALNERFLVPAGTPGGGL